MSADLRTPSEFLAEIEAKSTYANDIIAKAEFAGRTLTSEEQSELDAIKKQVLALDEDRKAAEFADEKKDFFARAMDNSRPKRITRSEQPSEGIDLERPRQYEPWTRDSVMYSKLVAFTGPDAKRDAYYSGRWLYAKLFNHQPSIDWLRRNQMHFAQSEGINSAGGALVPAPLSQAIINLREMYGVFRKECEVIPMGSDTLSIPRAVGGLTATFTAENVALTESDQVFDNVTLTAQKLGVITRISTELAEDALINVADMIARQMGEAFAYKEDLVGFIGNGSAAHGGIQGVVTKFEANLTFVGAVVAAGAANSVDNLDEINLASIHKLMGILPAYALPNAKWYVSQATYQTALMKVAAAAGGNTINTIGQGGLNSFLGYPVVVSQILPANPTTDYSQKVMLLFGDLRLAAAFGDRRGITVATNDGRYFELDQVAIRATERIDVNVHDIGSTTAAGPIIALVGN